MNPWYAKGVVLAAIVLLVALRAPHGQRSRKIRIVRSGVGAVEIALLVLAWISFFVPIVWIATSAFDAAEFDTRPAFFAVGVALYAASLWLFHRSHTDLGTNWSTTLQVRESHTLVTCGVYRSIRHPMYTALLLFSLAQAFVVPNWIAGPSYLAAMVLLVALRLAPEERLMRETFGADYVAYSSRTKRLWPGVW